MVPAVLPDFGTGLEMQQPQHNLEFVVVAVAAAVGIPGLAHSTRSAVCSPHYLLSPAGASSSPATFAHFAGAIVQWCY